jgi:hypothetical protein
MATTQKNIDVSCMSVCVYSKVYIFAYVRIIAPDPYADVYIFLTILQFQEYDIGERLPRANAVN